MTATISRLLLGHECLDDSSRAWIRTSIDTLFATYFRAASVCRLQDHFDVFDFFCSGEFGVLLW